MTEMEKNTTEFDHSGQYDSGLQSLVRSLRMAFFFLLVLIIGMLVYFFTLGGYVEVKPQEAVIVLRFGKFYQVYDIGWHWFVPYPVTRFVTVRTSPQFLRVDFTAASTSIDGGDQEGRPLEPGRDAYLMTGDANIIHTAWNIVYQVSDPKKYYEQLQTPADPTAPDELEKDEYGYSGRRGPQTLLTNFFRQAVIQVTSGLKVDDILYTKQSAYREAVQRVFAQLVEKADCGIEVTGVTLDRASAPLKTKTAFDEVAAASNTMSTLINEAKEYMVRIGNEVKADEVSIIAEAETYRKQVVAEVKAESQYFRSINEAYLASPKTVLMALYNQTLADVLEAQEGKYILGTVTGEDRKQVRLKINPEPPRLAKPANAEAE